MNEKELKHYENIALKEKDKPRLRHHALTKLCLIAEVERLGWLDDVNLAEIKRLQQENERLKNSIGEMLGGWKDE